MITKIISYILSFLLGILALPVVIVSGAIYSIKCVYGTVFYELKKYWNN